MFKRHRDSSRCAGRTPPQQMLGRKWVGPENPPQRKSCAPEEKGDAAGPDGVWAAAAAAAAAPEWDAPRGSEAADLTNREKLLTSSDQLASDRTSSDDKNQQGATEHNDDSRAPELQSVGSLKVTIQQSSESREFGQTDRSTDRHSSLHCHVCSISCCSVQIFQDHMMGSEHLNKMKEITHSISLKAHTEHNRRRQCDRPHWCDSCQRYFSGDVIVHRQTRDHKMCKKLSRPFCPVCQRHFRTPRKFVEHMKSPQHKQQVTQTVAQEEELITVDAVGCFEEEG